MTINRRRKRAWHKAYRESNRHRYRSSLNKLIYHTPLGYRRKSNRRVIRSLNKRYQQENLQWIRMRGVLLTGQGWV